MRRSGCRAADRRVAGWSGGVEGWGAVFQEGLDAFAEVGVVPVAAEGVDVLGYYVGPGAGLGALDGLLRGANAGRAAGCGQGGQLVGPGREPVVRDDFADQAGLG